MYETRPGALTSCILSGWHLLPPYYRAFRERRHDLLWSPKQRNMTFPKLEAQPWVEGNAVSPTHKQIKEA